MKNMIETYGLDTADFRIQLLRFTSTYLDNMTGMTGQAKAVVGLIIGNIIRSNEYTETDREKIIKHAQQNGYSYQEFSQIIEGALPIWLKHVDAFKNVN